MTKPQPSKAQAIHTASDAPGGYLPSDQLNRANTFALMRLALEATLTGDRNAVLTAVREAIADYAPEFSGHRDALARSVVLAEATGRFRDLETAVAAKVSFFAHAESATLGAAPRRPDATQIHAAALALANKAKAEQHRVRFSNY